MEGGHDNAGVQPEGLWRVVTMEFELWVISEVLRERNLEHPQSRAKHKMTHNGFRGVGRSRGLRLLRGEAHNHAAISIRSACAGPSLQLFVQNFLTRKIQDSVDEFHFVSFLRYGGYLGGLLGKSTVILGSAGGLILFGSWDITCVCRGKFTLGCRK